jgi:transposase
MSTQSSIRRKKVRKARRSFPLQKANGILHPRVQQAGPEHFAVICFDCAKARSKWLMSDFYGRELVEPTTVEHQRGQLEATLATIREAIKKYQVTDLVVAIERTGNYHLAILRTLARAEWEGRKFDTRVVHPFATKQHRQPANPGDKTDDHDLAAIFRATVAGFGLLEPPWDEVHRELQLLARHRRDLVQKRTSIYCQLREHLDLALPGYAALFDDKLWESDVGLRLIRQVPSVAEFQRRGVAGLSALLRVAQVRFHRKTLEKIVAWATNAVAPEAQAAMQHRIMLSLDDDRQRKTQEIKALEQELAHLLVKTPYVLLLSCPGINVVSAAELAGEMGPIANYARANRITGRAGLYRSRYQSDEVDWQHGPLVRSGNRRLRAVLMMIADNLVICNAHYRGLATFWKTQHQDERYIRTKIATKFTRLVFQLVSGGQVLRHPGMKGRDYILEKLLKFHQDHQTPPDVLLGDLQNAIAQLPTSSHADEAAPLVAELEKTRVARGGLKKLADILPLVLARLGVGALQSTDETQEPN